MSKQHNSHSRKSHHLSGRILAIVLVIILGLIAIIGGNYKEHQRKADLKVSKIAYDKAQAKEKEYNRTHSIYSKDWLPSKKYYKANRGNLTYSPMGDSLTDGFYASTEDKKFTSLFSDYLNKGLGYSVNLEGVSGYGGLSSNGVRGVSQVINQDPDLVSIEYGTNDADPKRKVKPDTLKKNLTTIVEHLNSMDRPPKIFFITTWKTDHTGTYDAAIKSVAKKYKLPVVDISEFYLEDKTSGPKGKKVYKGTSDDFHPNDLGMQLIARRMYNKTNAYIVK